MSFMPIRAGHWIYRLSSLPTGHKLPTSEIFDIWSPTPLDSCRRMLCWAHKNDLITKTGWSTYFVSSEQSARIDEAIEFVASRLNAGHGRGCLSVCDELDREALRSHGWNGES